MSQRHYTLICGAVFSIVAAGHLARLILGWNVSIAGWMVPAWISIVGVCLPAALSAWGLTLASRAGSTRRA